MIQQPMNLNGEKIKVLLVEDDVSTRKLERMILERNKYAVKEAECVRDALDIIEHDIVDIVILDIMLPDMNGIEMLKILRKDPITRQLPVILCSCVSDQQLVVQALELGISGYALKPIVAKELVQKVAKAEKQIVPILIDPSKTIYKLGLQTVEFRELVQIMVDDAKKKLKEIGAKIEVGELEEFDKFCRDLSSSAENFGAAALKNAALEANNGMQNVEAKAREKYMFNLRTQMERLKQAVIVLR